MNKFTASIISLPLLLSVAITHAEVKQYNIEIVIFENNSDYYLNSEQWPVIHHPETILDSEITTIKPKLFEDKILEKNNGYPDSNSVINITHNNSNQLAAHVEKLNRSSRYNVLLHQSWQQAGLSNEDAINIQIDTTVPTQLKNSGMVIFPQDKSPSMDDKPQSSIHGTLKLILGRYLHIHTDLLYKRLKQSYAQTAPTMDNIVLNEFEIKSQRRMRSNELHYIDHPLLGVLILVSPINNDDDKREVNL